MCNQDWGLGEGISTVLDCAYFMFFTFHIRYQKAGRSENEGVFMWHCIVLHRKSHFSYKIIIKKMFKIIYFSAQGTNEVWCSWSDLKKTLKFPLWHRCKWSDVDWWHADGCLSHFWTNVSWTNSEYLKVGYATGCSWVCRGNIRILGSRSPSLHIFWFIVQWKIFFLIQNA